MKILITIFLASLAAMAAPANAGSIFKQLETSIETTTTSISLPSQIPGRFVARKCGSCPAETFAIGPTSHFFIDRQEATFPAFVAAARKQPQFMMIHFVPETRAVTRLVIYTKL